MNDTFRLGKYCVDNRISLDDLKRLVPVVKQEKEQEFKTSLSQMDTLSQQKVKTGKIFVDCQDHIIVNHIGQVLDDKKQEVLICEFAIANYPEILSVSQIRTMLKTFGFNVSTKSVIVYVSRINKKIPSSSSGKYLKSIYKRGYVWNYPAFVVNRER
ncbi:helix-turn-helix domain-containing protein [Faecalitalea cylindroides]|uniref:helix-turn-helix domain-containing protein n=1 Tax=Faecalitalea cylindroides TaxID=39483 RepID=UPI00267620AE|nr:helix-turn-helix domain-containing protein [Faecalitalea cylindroides]